MGDEVTLGTERVIDGHRRVYYHGYWIRAYSPPADTLSAKKQLIEALTRRLFNHVEHGLNIPGTRLAEARQAYESETDPARQRVKGGMLAGALFNRATDIFRKVVELQTLGVEMHADNELLVECGEHFREALELGKRVLHRSGEEGIDELWGEPLKAFSFPIEEFYRSRYVKISQSMRDIDRICSALTETLDGWPEFFGAQSLIDELGKAAKAKTETLRTDRNIFDVWASFAVAVERLGAFEPRGASVEDASVAFGFDLLRRGRDLVEDITRARVAMPKSTTVFLERCAAFRRQ